MWALATPHTLGWSPNGKLRLELLKREWFQSLVEADVVIQQWRQYYNDERPHSALGRLSPTRFAAAHAAS